MDKVTLDFTAVWQDTVALLNKHKEAAVAIAGVFIFLPAWILSYTVGTLNTESVEDPKELIEIMVAFYSDNFLPIFISGLLTAFGTFTYYIVLSRDDMVSIGDALKKSLALFPIFLIVSIVTGFLTGLGAFAFLIGALYLSGRFSAVAGVVAAEPERGIIGSIKYGWALTHGVGWMAFLLIFIISIVGGIINLVMTLIFGLIFGLIGGSIGELLTLGSTALLGAILSVVLATVMIAIYRHLKPQVDNIEVEQDKDMTVI